MFQRIEIKYIPKQKKDREELLGPNEKYFINEFTKTHLSVVFLNFYVKIEVLTMGMPRLV